MSTKAKTTNLIRIPIGDWGNDGHGKYTNFEFKVPAKFTKEILSENYEKNKAEFGFGLNDFANEYEDQSIYIEQFKILVEAGYVHDSSNVDMEDDFEVDLVEKDLLKIAIFFISHGLEDFRYKVIEPDFTLFRGDSGTESMIGYGLFQ